MFLYSLLIWESQFSFDNSGIFYRIHELFYKSIFYILLPAIWPLENNHRIMANYELMMILIKKDVWGDKKLAYKIKGSETGHYVLWTLELDGTAIKGLNTEFNLEANIWRYMFVNLED